MHPRTVVVLILLFQLPLAGCTSAPPSDPLADIIAAYQPKTVRFIDVTIETVVQGNFSDAWTEVWNWPFGVRMEGSTAAEASLVSEIPQTLWLVQDGDTVIRLTHNITSNRHQISQQILAIAPENGSAYTYGAGLNFQFHRRSPTLVMAYFGPYTFGTFTHALYERDGPFPIFLDFEATADFVLFNSSRQSSFFEAQAPVKATISLSYWGNLTFSQQPEMLTDSSELAALPAAFDRYQRNGATTMIYSATCPQFLLTGYDPCLDPWARIF